jgi:hypothetical protein
MGMMVVMMMMMMMVMVMMITMRINGGLNSFQAIAPYMGQKKGVLFYGGVSPSKIGLIVPY